MKSAANSHRRAKKRRTPLQALWRSVTVISKANGKQEVCPVWRDLSPGVITRLYAERHLQKLIDAHLKGRK